MYEETAKETWGMGYTDLTFRLICFRWYASMTNMSRIMKLVLGSQGSLCDKWKCERNNNRRKDASVFYTRQPVSLSLHDSILGN